MTWFLTASLFIFLYRAVLSENHFCENAPCLKIIIITIIIIIIIIINYYYYYYY